MLSWYSPVLINGATIKLSACAMVHKAAILVCKFIETDCDAPVVNAGIRHATAIP